MHETFTAVVGTVLNEPRRRRTASGDEIISFRMASNSRRLDRQSGEWVDGAKLYLTVTCWKRLVAGVGAAVAKGRPVIAYGTIRTNEYTTSDGEKRADLEMSAHAVGIDLARGWVTYQGPIRLGDNGQPIEIVQHDAPVGAEASPSLEVAPTAA